MRLPPKDDPHGDREGRRPLEDVLTVLRRHGVDVTAEAPDADGDHCCTLVSDEVAEVVYLPDPVGGLMIKSLARKFGVDLVQFYFYRELDALTARPAVH